jgi:hypothetical protein
MNSLDLLFGRLLSGVGVRREILSLLSTLSVSNSTRPLAAKLFLIVGLVDWKASSRACW